MSPDDPRHGTTTGHAQHRRDNEKACRPCQDAANAASYARTYGDHDVPLTGGRWVPNPATGGLTKLWHAETRTA